MSKNLGNGPGDRFTCRKRGGLRSVPYSRNSRPPYAWAKKSFGSGVPPARRELAAALQGLCPLLLIVPKGGDAPTHNPTQGEVADRLKMCESALSRALSGKVLPQRGSVEILFEAASADAARQDIEVGVTLADLYRLHARAAAEQKGVVASRLSTGLEAASSQLREAKDENEQLREANEQLRDAYEELRTEHEELRTQASVKADSLRVLQRKYAVLRRKAASLQEQVSLLEAGSPAVSPDAPAATPLPVPRQAGDRQRTELDAAAARNVARRAETLYDGSRQAHEVLALLRHTTDAYSPAETALLVVLLAEEGQDDLVTDLIHIYGRDKPEGEVLRAALELLRSGAPAKAEALLRTAAETRRPNGTR
jgi:transcriptional regulator with XRE-family HTH domain